MKRSLDIKTFPLDFHWPTIGSFLFCVHHYDEYPKGTSEFAPEKSYLEGRTIGHDFLRKDGFRMYHGNSVPGFQVHPHRGFETITIVRKGWVDHADSMGAAGRYGGGDVQWMTAGGGVQHSEIFPLLRQDEGNTLELFQIWLNLPRKSKMVNPHFAMFWSEKIPVYKSQKGSEVSIIAGEYESMKALTPPPNSWANDPKNQVAIFLLKIKVGDFLKLPKAQYGTAKRTLYFFEGETMLVNEVQIRESSGVTMESDQDLELSNVGQLEAQILVLQAQDIPEPVIQHGPFVMNTRNDISQTIEDYQRTRFGGWPWSRPDMIHGPALERFAKYPDGQIERPNLRG